MDMTQYTEELAQQTRDFNAGKERGLREGGDDECEQDFAYKSVAYEDGYWTGWRLARQAVRL